MGLKITLKNMPEFKPGQSRALINGNEELLYRILGQELGYSGEWVIRYGHQVQACRERLRPVWCQGREVKVRTRPGDNSTCWELFIVPPANISAQEVYADLSALDQNGRLPSAHKALQAPAPQPESPAGTPPSPAPATTPVCTVTLPPVPAAPAPQSPVESVSMAKSKAKAAPVTRGPMADVCDDPEKVALIMATAYSLTDPSNYCTVAQLGDAVDMNMQGGSCTGLVRYMLARQYAKPNVKTTLRSGRKAKAPKTVGYWFLRPGLDFIVRMLGALPTKSHIPQVMPLPSPLVQQSLPVMAAPATAPAPATQPVAPAPAAPVVLAKPLPSAAHIQALLDYHAALASREQLQQRQKELEQELATVTAGLQQAEQRLADPQHAQALELAGQLLARQRQGV